MLKFSNDKMLIILQYSTHTRTHSGAGCVVMVVVGALENPAQGLCVEAK